MNQLIFASNNRKKMEEMQSAIGNSFTLITLPEAGIDIDIPEPFDTLEANASEKSRTIYRITRSNCFSEDTGLETEALDGAPGVKSARYAGEERSSEKNIQKLLGQLSNHSNRNARFRTVISLIYEGQEHLFEGICQGTIAHAPRGESGFGYDPVFVPAGSGLSFAEMTLAEKNVYSHRKKAASQLVAFLQNNMWAGGAKR